MTEKHTINSIQKSRRVSFGTDGPQGRADVRLIARDQPKTRTRTSWNNKFDRKDENEADAKGVRLANKAGYAPDWPRHGPGELIAGAEQGAAGAERDCSRRIPQLRIGSRRSARPIKAEKLAATAIGAARYSKHITFDAKPLAEVAGCVPQGTRPGRRLRREEREEGRREERRKEKDKKERKAASSAGSSG